MFDYDADLRTLYDAYSSQIEFSKTQLWRIAEYGTWALAGIMGISRGFGHESRLAFVFPAMVIAVLFICLYNMLKCWCSMVEGRKKFIKIWSRLSSAFQSVSKSSDEWSVTGYPYNYQHWTYDAWIVLPLMVFVSLGSCFVYILQVRDMGICSFGQFREDKQLSLLSLVSVKVFFVLFLIYCIRRWSKRFDKCIRGRGHRIFGGCCRNRLSEIM